MSNFRIEDAVNVLKEITGIIYDASQEGRFAFENREALRSKNFVSISSRLEMTKERYKIPIGILFAIVDIAENIASPPPSNAKTSRTSECDSCFRYSQQNSDECKKCYLLTNYTNMIPVYFIMQKAGEKGIEWGIDFILSKKFTVNDKARIKEEFYARPYQ